MPSCNDFSAPKNFYTRTPSVLRRAALQYNPSTSFSVRFLPFPLSFFLFPRSLRCFRHGRPRGHLRGQISVDRGSVRMCTALIFACSFLLSYFLSFFLVFSFSSRSLPCFCHGRPCRRSRGLISGIRGSLGMHFVVLIHSLSFFLNNVLLFSFHHRLFVLTLAILVSSRSTTRTFTRKNIWY